MAGFHKARLVTVVSGLSLNLILSVACLAQSASECEKRAALLYKDNGEKYYVGAKFSSPLDGAEKAVSEFYYKAFHDAQYRSITSCGFYVISEDVSRIPNYHPPACEAGWGNERGMFMQSAVIRSQAQFDELVHQTCRLETAKIRMTKFDLFLVNPKPPITYGAPPSQSNK